MRWFHFLVFSLTGGLLLGLGTRDDVPLWSAVPLILCGWKLMQIGLEPMAKGT